MGMTMTLTMSLENHTNQEGDLETEEEAKGTENLPTQENLQAIDKDLKADKVDRVIIIGGPKMKAIIKNHTDQKMKEEEEGVEATMVLIGLGG